MQFIVKDPKQDVLCISVLQKQKFSPNGELPGLGIDLLSLGLICDVSIVNSDALLGTDLSLTINRGRPGIIFFFSNRVPRAN